MEEIAFYYNSNGMVYYP